MHDYQIKPGTSFSLTLAADARLTDIDSHNDQIWNLVLNRGEPPGLVLETTYGLRARSQRIFPRFTEGDLSITSPLEFLSPITVDTYYPNFIQLSFTPLPGIQATLAYWVATSQVVAGQLNFRNTTANKRQLQVEWIGLLVSNPNGQRMVADEINNVSILHGRTEQLEPVLYVTGGAHPSNGSYTSLIIECELPAGLQASSTCTLASLDNRSDSFEAARSTANKNWSAETARIALVNASQIQVITGNQSWDKVLDLTQTIAASLLIKSSAASPQTSYVLTRQPDHGFSPHNDGDEYNLAWKSQSAFQTFFFAKELLPQYPQYSRAFLNNFLVNQTPDGFIDWKPGISQSRTRLASAPLICSLAWYVYEHIQDINFLVEIYPRLLKFIDYWFQPGMDRDQDGIPEWTHVFQTGFEDNPLFSPWTQGTKGMQISTIESPDLSAMLFNEIQSLIKMAELLGDSSHTHHLEELAKRLQAAVEASWEPDMYCYLYRDRDGHTSQVSQALFFEKQTDIIPVNQSFQKPVRLNFQIKRNSEATRRLIIFIHGTGPTGGHRVERIEPDQFEWHLEKGFVTSEKIYLQIEKIIIEGLLTDDLLSIRTTGLVEFDQTLLLPIWAKMANPDRVQQIMHHTLKEPKLFGNPYGIPTLPGSTYSEQAEIHIPYNVFILQGLLKYGFREEAAEIMTRLMNTLASQYEREGVFRKVYRAENGQGKGEANSLEGLAPLSTFLEILGVHIFSAWKIQISGFNPFPWPVTVKYCGTSILRQKQKTTIVFSDGQTMTFDDTDPHLVLLE